MIAESFRQIFFRQSSLENPAYPLSDPDDTVYEAFGAEKSTSGIRISESTALTYSAVWRACTLIGQDVAKLPFITYKRVGKGKERDTEHPAYQLLLRKPSPEINSYNWRFRGMKDCLLLGNTYALIRRDGGGRPIELIPLIASDVDMVEVEGVIRYRIRIGREQRVLPASEIFHVRGLGDGYQGMSVISKARNSLGIGLAAGRFAGAFFKNGARGSVAVTHPGSLKPAALTKLRESWKAVYGSEDGWGKPLLLDEAMKAENFGMSMEDAQFLGTRQFEIREIANWFGLPPHKLGDTTRTAYASLEQENQSYLDDALDGWLCAWEAEAVDKLLSEEEKENDTHFCSFLRNALVKANMSDRFQGYNVGIQGGWLSRNEVRAMEDLNPEPGLDEFLQPMNMGSAGPAGPPDEPPAGNAPPDGSTPDPGLPGGPPAPPAEDDEEPEAERSRPYPTEAPAYLRQLLGDVTRRMARRIAIHARKAGKAPESFCAFLEGGLEADHRTVIEEASAPVVEAVRAILGRKTTYTDHFLAAAKAELWRATDHPPAELAKWVDYHADKLEAELVLKVTEACLK